VRSLKAPALRPRSLRYVQCVRQVQGRAKSYSKMAGGHGAQPKSRCSGGGGLSLASGSRQKNRGDGRGNGRKPGRRLGGAEGLGSSARPPSALQMLAGVAGDEDARGITHGGVSTTSGGANADATLRAPLSPERAARDAPVTAAVILARGGAVAAATAATSVVAAALVEKHIALQFVLLEANLASAVCSRSRTINPEP